jgi:DNA-binding IclR family transcriptional regulator
MTPTSIYPKGDLRRMLAVLGAIQGAQDGITLVQIAKRTGLSNKTVLDLMDQAAEQAAVTISKTGVRYSIADLGPVFKRAGVNLALRGALNTL